MYQDCVVMTYGILKFVVNLDQVNCEMERSYCDSSLEEISSSIFLWSSSEMKVILIPNNTGKKFITQGKHRKFYLEWKVATLRRMKLYAKHSVIRS